MTAIWKGRSIAVSRSKAGRTTKTHSAPKPVPARNSLQAHEYLETAYVWTLAEMDRKLAGSLLGTVSRDGQHAVRIPDVLVSSDNTCPARPKKAQSCVLAVNSACWTCWIMCVTIPYERWTPIRESPGQQKLSQPRACSGSRTFPRYVASRHLTAASPVPIRIMLFVSTTSVLVVLACSMGICGAVGRAASCHRHDAHSRLQPMRYYGTRAH